MQQQLPLRLTNGFSQRPGPGHHRLHRKACKEQLGARKRQTDNGLLICRLAILTAWRNRDGLGRPVTAFGKQSLTQPDRARIARQVDADSWIAVGSECPMQGGADVVEMCDQGALLMWQQ